MYCESNKEEANSNNHSKVAKQPCAISVCIELAEDSSHTGKDRAEE